MRLLNPLRTIPAASLALLLLLSPWAGAEADRGDVEVRLSETDPIEMRVVQTWQGEQAAKMRQSLDALFGNRDGNLSADELARIEQATEADLSNRTFPLLAVDGRAPTVARADVAFEQAEGAVDAQRDLRMVHVLALDENGTRSGPPSITVHALWNGTLTLVHPESWRVADGDGGGRLQRELRANETTRLDFEEARAPEAPAAAEPGPPAEPPQEATGDEDTPAPGVLLAVAGLAAAAWLLGRRR